MSLLDSYLRGKLSENMHPENVLTVPDSLASYRILNSLSLRILKALHHYFLTSGTAVKNPDDILIPDLLYVIPFLDCFSSSAEALEDPFFLYRFLKFHNDVSWSESF